jgi:hypothetical protein
VEAFPLPQRPIKFTQLGGKVFKRTTVQETSFTYDKGKSFIMFDCESSAVTFWNITFAYGPVSLQGWAQSLFSSSFRQQGLLIQTLPYRKITSWSRLGVERNLSHPGKDLTRHYSLPKLQYIPRKEWTHYTWIKWAPKEEQWTVPPEPSNTKITFKKTIMRLFSLGTLYLPLMSSKLLLLWLLSLMHALYSSGTISALG